MICAHLYVDLQDRDKKGADTDQPILEGKYTLGSLLRCCGRQIRKGAQILREAYYGTVTLVANALSIPLGGTEIVQMPAFKYVQPCHLRCSETDQTKELLQHMRR